MPYKFIKLNRAKCLLCEDILISPKEKPDKMVTCRCGELTISGGSTHTYRKGKINEYKEMCVLDFSDCPEVNTETPIPPPNSTITAAQLAERKRNINGNS